MTDFYIDPTERRKIITFWVKVTLISLHGWASLIVLAAVFGEKPDAELLSAMFSTVTTGIGATIFILLVDKGADFIITKFGTAAAAAPTTMKETVTRTVETKPAILPENPPVAGDVTMTVEGDVNVSKNNV